MPKTLNEAVPASDQWFEGTDRYAAALVAMGNGAPDGRERVLAEYRRLCDVRAEPALSATVVVALPPTPQTRMWNRIAAIWS